MDIIPVEVALRIKQQQEDEYEKQYDPEDLSALQRVEVLEALDHMPEEMWRRFMDGIKTYDHGLTGEAVWDAVVAYRKL